MKARYFTVFSYIGTKFRSSEKLWIKNGSKHLDPESVQGMIEIALIKERPKNFPMIKLSSRTDAGVHALNCSAHFDLETRGDYLYNPDKITRNLNSFFRKANTPILVRKCIRVSDSFNARFQALSRTYLYRLAVFKQDISLSENTRISQIIPVEELNKCHFIKLKDFDIEKFKEGAKYFVGYHDFGTFRKFTKKQQHKHNRRTVFHIDVRSVRPLRLSYAEKTESHFDYYDIEIKGKSFVHNQIRRMIGTLIAVAIGKLPPEEIKVMLQIPSKYSWHNFISNCPPCGLYLCDVEYDPNDLLYEADSAHAPVTSDDYDINDTDTGSDSD